MSFYLENHENKKIVIKDIENPKLHQLLSVITEQFEQFIISLVVI